MVSSLFYVVLECKTESYHVAYTTSNQQPEYMVLTSVSRTSRRVHRTFAPGAKVHS